MTETQKNTTTDKKPSNKSAKPTLNKKSYRQIFLIAVLLVVSILASYIAWYFYQQQQITQQQTFNGITKQLNKLKRAQNYQSEDQQSQLNALEVKQKELRLQFIQLLKNNDHLRNDWLISEAEYLIKLANHRLILEQDINTAITALEAADQRLKEIVDPALLAVRKVLLQHIQSLRAISQPDVTGMALQIRALQKEIPALPMQTPDPATVQRRKEESSNASKIESWDQLPKAMWEDIKSLVLIRDHKQAVQPLIAPEQQYFLIQNLNLQLEQAQLALLKRNNRLYIDSLSKAKQWIKDYFDVNQQATKSILQTITALMKKNIEPTIPDISRAYKILQQYRINGFIEKKVPAKKTQPIKKLKSAPIKKPTQENSDKMTTTP